MTKKEIKRKRKIRQLRKGKVTHARRKALLRARRRKSRG